MNYYPTHFKPFISIDSLVTIHYFEYTKELDFQGESHDFFELVFLDWGEALMYGDETSYYLKKDDCILHPPMEFHTVKANNNQSINLLVITFHCKSPMIYELAGQIWHLDDRLKSHLCQILIEARQAFATPLHVPSVQQLIRRDHALIGAEQMLKLHLEMLIIQLLRQKLPEPENYGYQSDVKVDTGSPVVDCAIRYMATKLHSQITVNEVCRNVHVGRSYLHDLFNETLSRGILEYFSQMKIEFAKQLIRENSLNFTQVAEILGFSSVHYFSRRFKQVAGMTPSQYRSSIKSISEYVTSIPADYGNTPH